MSGFATAIAATVVSAGVGAYSAYEGSKNSGMARDLAMSNEQRANITFNEQQQYADQLKQLMADPSSVKSLPGFQFNFDMGAQAVARQMGASGFAGSGNEAIGLEKYGTGYADAAYSTQANLLAGLSGLQVATSPSSYSGNANSALGTAIQGQGQNFQQLSSILAGIGGAAGYFGGGGFTTNDYLTLASGAGNAPTYNSGGYIYNNPAYKGP